MTVIDETGAPVRAAAGRAPDRLAPPEDLAALAADLWPRSAVRGDDGALRIGGLSATEIAERFGTPVVVFDEADFRTRCAAFRSAFHDFDIYYAGKAFLCKAIARIVAESGLRLDACSSGELAVARAAGFPMRDVVLHGNNKSTEDLAEAVRTGVGRIVIDSIDEIDRLTRIAAQADRRPRVFLRATVGIRSDAHDHNATAHEDQKFGFSLASGAVTTAVGRVLDERHLDLAGLHVHIGSQILDTTAYDEATRRALRLHAALQQEYGAELPELSLGGGFGIAYTTADRPATPWQVAETLRGAAVTTCAELGVAVPRLAIEPGRAIVGPAGVTLYRVGTIKPVPGYRTYVAVDGGMSDNIRPALFGANYSVTVAGRVATGGPMLSRVVGKHCDAGDVIVRDAYLPADLRPGDLLAVPATAAYCRSLSNNFNHTPRPPVVAVRDGAARAIVRRETVADILRLDVG
jgi:diaminopimelate decarboxylase